MGNSSHSKDVSSSAKAIRRGIFIVCYIAALLLWLAIASMRFLFDTQAYTNGDLYVAKCNVSDFEKRNLTVSDNNEISATAFNPRLVYRNVQEKTIRSIRFSADIPSDQAQEVVLHYTNFQHEDFSAMKSIKPDIQPDGSYYFVLPFQTFEKLSITLPNSISSVAVNYVLVNEPLTAKNYFIPRWFTLLLLLVCPAVLAVVTLFIRNILYHLRNNITAHRWLRRKKQEIANTGDATQN